MKVLMRDEQDNFIVRMSKAEMKCVTGFHNKEDKALDHELHVTHGSLAVTSIYHDYADTMKQIPAILTAARTINSGVTKLEAARKGEKE